MTVATTTPMAAFRDAMTRDGKQIRSDGRAQCPRHDGNGFNLAVSEGQDGTLAVYCHSNECTAADICDGLGLNVSELFPHGTPGRTVTGKTKVDGKPATVHATSDAAISALGWSLEQNGVIAKEQPPSFVWDYHNAAGDLVGKVVRWDTSTGKEIRQIRRHDHGWICKAMESPRPLYRLPDVAAVWRELADIRSVSDFKEASYHRLLDDLTYELVSPDGKIKHGTLGEEKFTHSVQTYAKMMSLTREDIKNDSLDAFDTLRKRLGVGAAMKLSSLFWETFLNDSAFFTAGRGNYIDGPLTNLGTDGLGLQLGLTAFETLRSPTADGSKRVNGKPSILLVPNELGPNAEKFYQNENASSGTTVAATKRHARRVDYEYERCGTACIFMFTEPLAGWREVRVRDQRTKVDWAIDMERLLKTRYRNARKVILVCDNLNTHTKGAFYEAFPAQKARELVRRIEFRHTPKHGSWLNMAENELSSMTRQCVTGRRFATTKPLKSETKAWGTHSNKRQRAVDWQFNVQNARAKLKSLYPNFKG